MCVRRRLHFIAIAAIAALVRVAAQEPQSVQTLTAKVTGLKPGTSETLELNILRWSTDEESRALAMAFKEKGGEGLASALQRAESLGYVWVDGESLGYALRYARLVELGGEGARIVVATDRPLGSWSPEPWRVTGLEVPQYPFSLLELRLGSQGGEGKASLAAGITLEEEAKLIALDDYAAAPVIFTDVKRTPR